MTLPQWGWRYADTVKRTFLIPCTGLVACAPAANSATAPLPIRAGQLWQHTVTPEGQPATTGMVSVKALKFATPIDAPEGDSSALMAGEIARSATVLYFSKSRTIQLSLYSALNQETGRCPFVFEDRSRRVAISDSYADWKTSRGAGTCEIRLLN